MYHSSLSLFSVPRHSILAMSGKINLKYAQINDMVVSRTEPWRKDVDNETKIFDEK